MEEGLKVVSLSKKFATFSLKDVSFEVKKGRINGFIGRNGAGKTTTLKCIAGLSMPNGGDIYYEGRKLEADDLSFKNDLGLIFGGVDFYLNQKLSVITDVTRRFYSSWDEDKYREWISLFSLDQKKKIKELSNGMRVKYSLALALSHHASLLLLDEPTSGLDPVSRDEVLDCFSEIAEKEKAAILFSTHVISDLERVADDITYIKNGEILYTGDIGPFEGGYIHVEGEESSLKEDEKSKIKHLRIKGGRFDGLIGKDEALLSPHKESKASLEEIMVAIERGEGNEKTSL